MVKKAKAPHPDVNPAKERNLKTGTTRKDLLAILRQYEGYGAQQPAAVREAEEARDKAHQAVNDFLENSREYQRLSADRELADKIYSRASSVSKKEREESIRKVRNLIWSDGPTPEVIAKVKELAEQFEAE